MLRSTEDLLSFNRPDCTISETGTEFEPLLAQIQLYKANLISSSGHKKKRYRVIHDTSCHFRGRHTLLFLFFNVRNGRSQQPRGLRRRSTAARLLRLWVRISLGAWTFVCCECCVLSGRGLCDELITRPEESYRLWSVVVFVLETSKYEAKSPLRGCEYKPTMGCDAEKKKLECTIPLFINNTNNTYVTLQSSTYFEHQHAYLQEDKMFYHSIWYRHSLYCTAVYREPRYQML